MSDELLTVKGVAEFLGVNYWTVIGYISTGKLKAHKLGNGTSKRGNKRRWRIWKEDLHNFVNQGNNILDE